MIKSIKSVDKEYNKFKKSVEELKFIENELKDIFIENLKGGLTQENIDKILNIIENKTRYTKDYFLLHDIIGRYEDSRKYGFTLEGWIESEIVDSLSVFQVNYMLDRFFFHWSDDSLKTPVEIFIDSKDNRDKLLYLWNDTNHSTEEKKENEYEKYKKVVEELNFMNHDLRSYLKQYISNEPPVRIVNGMYVEYLIDDYIKKYDDTEDIILSILMDYEQKPTADSDINKKVDALLDYQIIDYMFSRIQEFYPYSDIEVNITDICRPDSIDDLMNLWEERKI